MIWHVWDPFSRSLEQRRRIIPDGPWYGAGLVTVGLTATTMHVNWLWTALVLTATGIGVVLLWRWSRARRDDV